MEQEDYRDAETGEDKQHVTQISKEVGESTNTKASKSSAVVPADIAAETDKEKDETISDFRDKTPLTKETNNAQKKNDSLTQEPKKKKRRHGGSSHVSSLHTLLHGNFSSDAGNSEDEIVDKRKESNDSLNKNDWTSDKTDIHDNKDGNHDMVKKNKNRSSQSLKSKKMKSRNKRGNLYVNDEAEETDENDDDTKGKNHKSFEVKRGLKRKNKLHSSNKDDDDDEDEDEDEGYEELKDFITDEVDDGIYDQAVYSGASFDNLNDIALAGKGDNRLLGSFEEDSDNEDDDDDEILRGELEEDDLELIEENTGIRLKKNTQSQKHRLRKVSQTDEAFGKTLVGKDIVDLEDLLFSGGGDDDDNDNEIAVGNSYMEESRLGVNLDDDVDDDDVDDDDDGWMVYDTDERPYKGDEYSIIQSVFGDYNTVMDILMNKFNKYKTSNKTDVTISGSDTMLDPSSSKKNTDNDQYELDEEDEALFGTLIEEKKDEDNIDELGEKIKATTLKTTTTEPGETQKLYLVDFDTEVKEADIPERLYLLYNERWNSLEDKMISKEELEIESNWITKKFLRTYPELFREDFIRRTHSLEFKSSFPFSHGGSDMFQMVSIAVFKVLDWILNERLDIPFITLHKIHLVQPPLNEFLIGKIVFLDSIYCNLKLSIKSIKQKLFNQRNLKALDKYSNILEVNQHFDNDDFISAFLTISGLNEVLSIDNFESNDDLDQLRLYATYHIETQRFKHIVYMNDNDAQYANIDNLTTDFGRKQRQNLLTGLFEHIESKKLYSIWDKYVVSPYVLSLYMKSFSFPQFHCSVPTSSSHKLPSTFTLLPPVGPEIENSKAALNKWFDKYAIPENPHFHSGEKIIESLIIYESKRLATFPLIRTKVYEYFFSNACITTITTIKGEKNLIPNNTSWLAGRLFRKPINTLFPGTYLPLNDDINDANSNFNALFDGCLASEVFELEKQGLIEIIIHPLCSSDDAPWRGGSDGENRIKERFLHHINMFKLESDSNSSHTHSHFDRKNVSKTTPYSSEINQAIPGPIQNRFEQEMRMYRNSDNVDNRIIRSILDELKYGYVSVSGNIWSKNIQVPILNRLIEKELFPLFRRNILNFMKSRSQEYIAELCSLNLQKRLRLLPPRKPIKISSKSGNSKTDTYISNTENKNISETKYDYDSDESDLDSLEFNDTFMNEKVSSNQNITDSELFQIKGYNTNWGLNIISCVVEKAQNGFKVCITALDIFGEPKDYLILYHLLVSGSSIHKFSKILNNENHDKADIYGSKETQRFEDDLYTLIKFTKTYYPHYICIGVSDRKSLELGSLWENIVLKRVKKKDKEYIPDVYFVCMDVSRALVRKIRNESTEGSEQNEGHPIIVDMAISIGRLLQNPLAEQLRLWDDSNYDIERELCVNIHNKNELSNSLNNSTTTRHLGRRSYDRNSGMRSGFNPITCLKLHKYQDSVDNKLLQFHLLMAIRSVVSNLGVQINRMKSHRHLQSPLRFVSGLGPRKAKQLAFYIDSTSEPFYNRNQLKLNESNISSNGKTNSSSSITISGFGSEKNGENGQYDYDDYDYHSDFGKKGLGCLTKNVYLNSQVFFRIDEEGINEKEFNKNFNIFDISRLSDINDIELVTTVLGNIKDTVTSDTGTNYADSAGKKKNKIKDIDETLYWSWISKQSDKLETLDLEAYAKLMYENQKVPRLLPYLNRMLRELKKPYDCTYLAREIKGMDRSAQIKEAMQISKEDLFIGSEITCRVTEVAAIKPGGPFPKNPVSFWFDQYGMRVVVEDFEGFWEELMDELPILQSIPLASIFKINTPLQATITNIDFIQNCIFVSFSQGKICSTLNHLIETVWRQQQLRSEGVEENNNTNRHGSGSPALSLRSEQVPEFQRNSFNLLQDDLSSLLWTDIRHYAYVLFKRNLNVISNCSKHELSSFKGDSDFKDGAVGKYLRGTIHRTIHHPNYKALGHDEIMNYMKDENIPIGEVVIRSSNRYIDKLIMYVKVCDNPFMVKIFNINEFDQRLPGELGRRLKIDDLEFNDIDQILIQYVHPLKVHLSTVYTHSKYRANMEYQNLISELLVESTRSGNSIIWGIVADKQIPCRFHLISVPPNTRVGTSGARIHFEDGIYVTQKGFQLWRKSEATLRKLLNWWKTEGFFKRSHYLEEYRLYKESMVREKQGSKKFAYNTGINSKRLPPNPSTQHYHNTGHFGNSGYGDVGYQNQRYPYDTHSYYSNRGYEQNTLNDGYNDNNRGYYRR